MVVPITLGNHGDVPPDGVPELTVEYIALVARALADGLITDGEASGLAGQACRAGTSRAEIEGLHRELLEFMRRVAEQDRLVTAAMAAGLGRRAAGRSSPVPAGRARVPGRVLVLGSGRTADHVRGLAAESGAEVVRNLTAEVTHVVVTGPVDAAEPRLVRARARGVPVCSVDALLAEVADGEPRRRYGRFARSRRVLPGRSREGETL